MIRIVSFKICPFVQRVTALLEAKGIPYDIEYIQLSSKPEWFLDISPTGQVPVLITESGTPLFESDAIVEYLDEIYLPFDSELTAEQRAIDRAWSYQATKHYLVQCGAMRSADAETLAERAKNLGRAFARIEQALREGPFFRGEAIGNVDIAWLPLLHRAEIIRQYSGYDYLDKFTKVKAWQSMLMKTGIPDKSVSSDFEQAFSEFYLSSKTFLGANKRCENNLDKLCVAGSCC